MKLSIIIPVKNEEKCLPRLLKSIKSQDFDDFEVIVADANSTDRTPQIVKEFGYRLIEGGIPQRGRNNGAKVARSELLFFFDSDVVLPKGFLKKAYNEMQDRLLDLSTCKFKPISKKKIDIVLHDIGWLIVSISQYGLNPKAPGFAIFVTKRLHDRIGGFDETLKVADDVEYTKRASKFRNLRVLEKPWIWVDVRRLEKEGRLTLARKYLTSELHRTFIGEIRKTDVIKYEFDAYDKKDKKIPSKKHISLFEKKLKELKKYYTELAKGNGKNGKSIKHRTKSKSGNREIKHQKI